MIERLRLDNFNKIPTFLLRSTDLQLAIRCAGDCLGQARERARE